MSLSIRKSLHLLFAAIAILIFAGWLTQLYAFLNSTEEFQTKDCHGFIRLFYLDGEANVPAWFQSTTLLTCSFLLALIWHRMKAWGATRHWQIMALIFLLLSLDEAACLHEGIGSLLSGVVHTSGVFTYAWVIPGGVFALVFFLSSWNFLQQLPKITRWQFILAGLLYVSGTLGWEMLGGWYDSMQGSRNLTYMTLTTLEEGSESIGIVLFIRALLIYLKRETLNSNSRTILATPFSEHRQMLDVTLQD